MSEPTTTQNVRYANTRRTSHILWWVDMRSVRDARVGDGFWMTYCGKSLNSLTREDVTDSPRCRICSHCLRRQRE
jgi:hypothetical protein